MTGSETFIIVAFMCSENSTPFSFASAICSVKKERSAETLIFDASSTSPASSLRPSFRTCVCPSASTSWIFTVVGCSSVTLCSDP